MALRWNRRFRGWGRPLFWILVALLGLGPASMILASPTAAGPTVGAIAGGGGVGYALKSDGTVWAWGDNSRGQVGNGLSTPSSNGPVRIYGLTAVTAIAAGGGGGYALKSDGTVWAWGDNSQGELGNGTTINFSDEPVQVSGLTGVTAIAGSDGDGYALKSDGTVWAWGDNSRGELGNGTTVNFSSEPVRVSGLTSVTAVAGEGSSGGYALKSDGTVWAWGENVSGQLGNGTTGSSSNVPVQVSGLTGVVAISGGEDDGYALKPDGTVWAWGDDITGVLGSGFAPNDSSLGVARFSSNVPLQVSGLAGVTAIAGGFGNGYALKSDGTVWAWGWNTFGDLGNGTTVDSITPAQVVGLTGITAIAPGYARKSDGTVWAWGMNPASGEPTTKVVSDDGESAEIYKLPVQVQFSNVSAFTDLGEVSWAEPAIDALHEANIANGVAPGEFAPNAILTRAQFTKFLVFADGLPVDSSSYSPFSDATAKDWFTPYVVAAFKAGLVRGTSGSTFSPNDPVTQEQMLVMLARLLGPSAPQADPSAITGSNPVDSWAQSGVAVAVAAHLLDAFPTGSFQSQNPADRAQAAQVIYNYLVGVGKL